MSKISLMMDVGKRALMNNQTALQTVTHNIASKNVEGFSRQRVDQVTNLPIGEGQLRIGTGAKPAAITRTTDQFLEKQLRAEDSKLGFAKGQSEKMYQIEQIFNEQTNEGLNRFIGNFFNAFRELANSPESTASRALVKESGNALVGDFKRIKQQLKDIQKSVDFQVNAEVGEINSISKEIADLNDKIRGIEMQGAPANDERDRRELLLKRLSDKVNIRFAEGDNGQVQVIAGNSAILVSSGEAAELMAAPSANDDPKKEGRIELYLRPYKTQINNKVTAEIKSGQLGGVLDIRDRVVNELHDKIDNLAYVIVDEVNKAHGQGYDRNFQKGGLFFDQLNGKAGAADYISLSDNIKNNVNRIAAAAEPNSPADNRIANLIGNIQNRKIMSEGNASLDDFYNGMVGEVGVQAKRANDTHEHQSNIVKQLTNIRESISGVSLDEEAVKMIEYQRAFDAAAKMIKVTDELLETVLSLKR